MRTPSRFEPVSIEIDLVDRLRDGARLEARRVVTAKATPTR